MGADLYLPTVLQDCYARYGRAHQLARETYRLTQGDVQPTLHEESQRLKEALTLHAHHTGAMAPTLFDLVAEIADLAQAEVTVWAMALAEQIAALIPHTEEETTARVGETGPAGLAHDLVALLKGHPDAAIPHGARWLAQRLEHAATSPMEGDGGLTPILAKLGTSMVEVLQGNPTSALAILVEHQMIPLLARACADQVDCLRDLSQALDPIISAVSSSSSGETDFLPGPTLARWHHLASRFHEATETVQASLSETLSLPVFQDKLVARHLAVARARIRILWSEGEELLPELEAAMKTLGSLLVRTLPSPTFTQAHDSTPEIGSPASPLRQAFGTILRHQVICHEMIALIERCAHVVEQVLAEEPAEALRAISHGMVALLAADAARSHPHEPEWPFAQHLAESGAPTIALARGVTLLPGTLMDMHYAQMMAAIRQSHQQHLAQEWVERALSEEHTSSVPGMILGFWRLLQGEPLLWVTLLAKRLREALTHEIAPTPESERASALVDQFLDLLAGEPALRLQALLGELQATIPACSPLTGPAACLVQLARGQTRSHVIDRISKLSNEVQHHAAHADWPEERLRDLGWLLALAHALVHAPQEKHVQILLTTLSHLCAACDNPEQEGAETEISARLTQALARSEQDDALLRRLQTLLETLPEMGPQPPRADPRLNPVWRFRLLSELITQQLSLDGASMKKSEDPEPFADDFPLVEHVLWAITRVLSAWLFPPEGYFRDPYTDASILWVAAGAFWPSIADQITEPVDEPGQLSSPWLAEEGEIPAQIPLARVRELAALLSAPSSNLPEQHHLARWGTHTIRVEADGPYRLSAWHAYFERRRQALLAFLEEAITREEPILCSL